jgi:metal-responsive CopG/Arc/MetJ family transcriptional regulator
MRRVTLSLPEDLIELTDTLAGQEGTSLSGFIQRVLASFVQARRRRELAVKLAEGYRAMASESSKLAEGFAVAETEALLWQTGVDDDGVDW